MRVRFAEAAEADLEEIGDWIAVDNLARAASFVAELRNRCMSLSTRPKRFPVVRHANGAAFRRLNYRNYLIFYVVFSDRVEIVHVVHGARDWASLLESES